MRVALISPDVIWEKEIENVDNYSLLINNILSKHSNIDLMVFPEFFSTGFSVQNDICHTQENSYSLKWVFKTSNENNIAILVSLPIKEDGKRYNRAFFVKPDGSYQYYNKRHLFSYGGENRLFTPGNKITIVEYKGFKIGLNICYDLRFPVWTRNIDLKYDLLINIANWPSSRSSVIEPLAKARAIENLSYFAFVNRSGNDIESSYNGERYLFDFMGRAITPEKDGFFFSVFDLSLDSLNEFRSKFIAWQDADNFKII